MPCNNPTQGSNAKHYYVVEATCGVTPANPVWQPIRFTGGTVNVTGDPSISAELNGTNEQIDYKRGTFTPQGEIAIEFSAGSHQTLLSHAIGSAITARADDSGATVTVSASGKTFTRAAGDFTAKASVGSIVSFPDLTGANAYPFRVKAVTATVITVEDPKNTLTDQSSATTDIKYSSSIQVGTTRKTVSILTSYPDADSGNGEYALTTGMEAVGFSIDGSPNARVTGSITLLGGTYTPDAALPSGSTFEAETTVSPYHYVEGNAYIDGASTKFTSLSVTNDNGGSAQFELGSGRSPSFIERGLSNNTVSIEAFFRDFSKIKLFLDGTVTRLSSFYSDNANAMNIEMPLTYITEASEDPSAPTSVTQTLSGTCMGSSTVPSITIHELIA